MTSTRTSGRGWLATLMVAGAMFVAWWLVHPSATPVGAATDSCLEKHGLAAPGTAMPVVLVHGFRGSAASMEGFERRLDATSTEFALTRFDYEPLNREWVDHDGIGGELRRHLVCLADASLAAGGIGRVGLVGHSMGGLAIRVALEGGPDEPALSEEVALVVTLGTPHAGSRFGTDTRTYDFAVALHSAVSRRESGATHEPLDSSTLDEAIADDLVLAPSGTPAALALLSSDALGALPEVPERLPVLSVAADYVEEPRLVNYTRDPIHHGDLIVDANSASKHAREVDGLGGVEVHRCYVPSALNPLGGFVELAVIWRSDQRLLDCWHAAIVSAEPTTSRAVTQLIAASGREPRHISSQLSQGAELSDSPPEPGCVTVRFAYVGPEVDGSDNLRLVLLSRDPDAGSGYARPSVAEDVSVELPVGRATGQAGLKLLEEWAEPELTLLWICGPSSGLERIVAAGDGAPDPSAPSDGADGTDRAEDTTQPSDDDRFWLPSRNIACQYVEMAGGDTLRCDIMSGLNPEPDEPCDGGGGWFAIYLEDQEPAIPICPGDSIVYGDFADSGPVLEYGRTWERGELGCRAEQTGLECWSQQGHGFRLARSGWEAY